MASWTVKDGKGATGKLTVVKTQGEQAVLIIESETGQLINVILDRKEVEQVLHSR